MNNAQRDVKLPSNLNSLLHDVQTFSLSQGHVMGIKDPPSGESVCSQAQPMPCTLYPSPFPEQCFDRGLSVAPLFNLVIDRIARDREFINKHLQRVVEVDEFTSKLLNIYNTVHDEGIAQSIMMGIHRSDYMLHSSDCESDSSPTIYQVEINTIASAFGCISTLTQMLHEYLFFKYPSLSKQIESGNRPRSDSKNLIPEHMAKAFNAVGKKDGIILFIVQEGEANFADQKHLENILWEEYNIMVVGLTLAQVIHQCHFEEKTRELTYNERPINVVYFRSGYSPRDYPSDVEWEARLLLERSTAVKCPSIGYHLAGTKKIQQVLAQSNVLEHILPARDVAAIREVFTGIYSLEDDESKKAINDAINNPKNYVLKPQREGGGNLVTGEKMVSLLKEMSVSTQKQYILMNRIKASVTRTHVLRGSSVSTVRAISEFGVYGLFLGDGKTILENKHGGYLVRTKAENVEDGGVAAGVAVMDSLVLRRLT